ncbi:MAG: cytochrome c [Paracoccaceae bacterium]|nr:cytochrome c [Paracoccaceae bacterium]
MKKTVIAVIAALIVLAAVILMPATSSRMGVGVNTRDAEWPAQFRSNGERIYFTGASSSGLPIRPTGGGMRMQMHGGGCVTCHGTDRLGGRIMPRFWISAPPLTPKALFGEGDAHEDDGHGDHDAYDEESLARAIAQGIDPESERLDPAMPRWSMADQDLADLIAFLRTGQSE